MQNSIFLFALWALMAPAGHPSLSTNTAGPGGLYSTYADFKSGRLTYPLDCSSNKDKLKLNELFGSSRGYALVNGEKHYFSKNHVYGYRDCKNRTYRFYNNSIYEVVDTAGFFIYYTFKTEHGPGGKGTIKNDVYFFSATGDDALQSLTVDNLKKAFPEKHRFHYDLDAVCRTDKDLTEYDSSLKTYRVKYLFSQSSK